MEDEVHNIAYVGNDADLLAQIRSLCDTHGWGLETYPHPDDFLKHPRSSHGVEAADEIVPERHATFVPVILDLDFIESESREAVRRVKSVDGATPVIVVGRNTSLAALSVARLDGAEALFHAPLHDELVLAEAIAAVFSRGQRWRESIRQSAAHARRGSD
jgi:DNA-binding NarL/FixJ family response regulator